MKTIYKVRWYLNSIDGGRDTTELELALQDVKYALENGYEHVEIKTESVPATHPDVP